MMNKILKLQQELDKAKKELEIVNWGLSKTNEAIKILYKDLEQKNKALQKAKDKLAINAAHDSLTKLVNRRFFKETLEKCISHNHDNQQTALLFLDLDNFKFVNDKFGHQIGDSLLSEVSKRLKRLVKQKDICARYGGDEFAILLLDVMDISAVKQIAERIVETIRKPFYIDGNVINTSISIGIALLTPDIRDSKSLHSMADMAMYKAKQIGKNCYQLYSDDFASKYQKQLSMEIGLQTALENNELYLLYQPIVNITNKTIVGIEALLRWKHPIFGEIPPLEFIPIAEKSGIIYKIGLWVIEETCRQIQKYSKFGIHKIFFSINLSPKQLENRSFKGDLSKLLHKYNINPEQLNIELTETDIGSNFSSFHEECLAILKQTNLQLSIDDFGASYSSLNRIAKLPISTLKIDGSFLKSIETEEKSRAIIKGIIGLAQNLNLQVIAECVETKKQVDFLKENRCNMAQGFYFYRPMTENELKKIILNKQTT